MKKILHLGNTLNQGTARGSALGFKLDSLLKLTDTRASNNKMTLMHYLCKVLAAKTPELLDFHEDLVSLEAGSKIQLKSLAEEMQAILKGIEKVKQELAASENDGPVSETFCKTLKEFVTVAETDVASVTHLYSHAGRNADALALYFGEDPARCPFEQVIATLLNFVRMFCKAHEENCKQAELEKKKARKEAEVENTQGLTRDQPMLVYYFLLQTLEDAANEPSALLEMRGRECCRAITKPETVERRKYEKAWWPFGADLIGDFFIRGWTTEKSAHRQMKPVHKC
ncbi:formin-like protein 6 [Salvia splendens]|uniref:formin-like protein 6 n=1 Tax=Salvia splendens TaxID=180675 RepID=UPI001C25C23D|nr:formin-like protein 6 [Salvia splendens]